MAWNGQHRGRGTPSEERARRSSQAESNAQRKARLKAEGCCIRCAKPNDRAGTLSKNGREAVVCTRCLAAANREAEEIRRRAQAEVANMRRALGLPDEG